METIAHEGYFFWGPFKGPGPLVYNIVAIDTQLDVFVFDQPNFFQYQYDAARVTPFQTGYAPVRSMLNILNAQDTVPLDTTSSYYLVVDHTLIGGAQGTNQNGVQVFLPDRFTWDISGVDYGTPFNTAPVVSAASSTMSPIVALVVAAASVVVALL
jgi:hypothetical protein